MKGTRKPPTSLDELPEIMNVETAARYLRVGRETLYDAIRKGTFPHTRVGARVVVYREALRAHLMSQSGDDGGHAATRPVMQR